MDANTVSPKALFQKNVRYMIPAFQRPYVWSQEDQWEPLWNDVRNTAERFLEEIERLGENRRADAERETPSHFLGAVVLQQEPTPTIEIEQRIVIDGQQRLITLQLLLDAAQETCEKFGYQPEARRLSKLVLNDEDIVGTNSDHEFKIWPTNLDRGAFRDAMRNDVPTSSSQDSRIVQAHEYFQLQVSEWLQSESDVVQQRLMALETALTGLLQMVVIDLEPADDSNIIFETLNARGTPLIESDLIKNFILYQARRSGLDEERINKEHWEAVEDSWWREEIRQGRLVRPRVDVFLNYWLSMRTAAEVLASQVFRVFRTHSEGKNIESVASDIKHISKSYRSLEEPTEPEEMTFVRRWKTLDAGVVTPLLLQLYSTSADRLPPANRVRSLHAIESFLVRRMVCRLTTKDYNRLFLELVKALQERPTEAADDVIVEFLRTQTAESREWPEDKQLKDAFLALPLYRLLTRGRLRLVLEGVEQELRTSMTEQQDVPMNLTIEHVMPQAWREHWAPPTSEVGTEEPATERDRIIHSLGNLTLVNERLNPHLSNGPWSKKREALGQHSVLFLNKELLGESYLDRWDEGTIRTRGERLAEVAAKVWSRPSTG